MGTAWNLLGRAFPRNELKYVKLLEMWNMYILSAAAQGNVQRLLLFIFTSDLSENIL
jgi:hypothetical protein